ncbi:alpha/beta fold hydrolase [Nocardia bhagyanarayanae]|uniref:Nucleoside-diphosphate-sugar epimerase n=1 Tax=Nocardia bhagyanarayanae TaxID=1215925 RepID=A0A543FHG0_9NOCA|nr:alpha/beta fold hydrolase [Nocardia bhagyanarayanae]TQM33261.1 nucleoside-diphosphate-sugar epimerase [Nocardia bhagyanarayanae]
MNSGQARHALVFGATGFVGRHLILALDAVGVSVLAACRTEISYQKMTDWLTAHGCRTLPKLVSVDFDAPGLGLSSPAQLTEVSEIYNCAGAYRFGMSEHEARKANVDSVRAIVALASEVAGLRRLVLLSGYRTGGQDPAQVPWSPERIRHTYRALGAYEASKAESDAVFQSEADRLGVPWSIVNPSSVSGVGATGESDQYLGLADSFHQLWNGGMAALPGSKDTFVPVVPVDYLARFMSLLPLDPTTQGRAYWILDEATPALPELFRVVAQHYRVKVPAIGIPVGLLKLLPRALTKADPETIGFMSTDRYPTASAQEFAARHGLTLPESVPAIQRWADHLAAHRFGEATTTSLPRRFSEYAGVRTFRLGPDHASTVVLPGLPVNAETWAAVAETLEQTIVADLPGLGMSDGDSRVWPDWLDHLLSSSESHHVVGHSIGAAAAVEAAGRNPGRVRQLTLVSPFFLQRPAPMHTRISFLTEFVLRRMSSEALSRQLTGGEAGAPALRTSVTDLRRAGTAGRTARLLRATTERQWRTRLIRQLTEFGGSVHLIVGSEDPLAPWASEVIEALGERVRTTTIDGAGHHPQLTHPTHLAHTIQTSPATHR